MGKKNEARTEVIDESPEWHLWTRVPNITVEKIPDAYEFKLYFVLKRVAGDSGTCWYTTEHLAEIAGMSVGSVVKARRELQKKGLIRCELRKPDGSRGRPCYHITIVDIWEENERVYQARMREGISSPDEENEGISSSREAKKNLGKKNHQEEGDGAEESSEFLKAFGVNEPLLTEIAQSHDLAWCQAAASKVHATGGIVHLHRQGWRPAKKAKEKAGLPLHTTLEERARYYGVMTES